jgi:GNAT superfamily N-acetyltransferase
MEFMLRPARPTDASDVAEIFLAAYAEMRPYVRDVHTDDEIRAWIGDVVLRENEIVIAEVEGRPAGFAALHADLLGHLYVHPDLQRRGIGDVLLARVKELRPRGFRLWVFQRNTGARRFYERQGLRLVKLTDGSGNEEREPDALYEWRP